MADNLLDTIRNYAMRLGFSPQAPKLMPQPDLAPSKENLILKDNRQYQARQALAAAVTPATLAAQMIGGVGTALATYSPEAEAALLPKLFYHGSRKDFKDHLPGLKFFTEQPQVAAEYASGAGGQRGRAKTAGFLDEETGNVMEYKSGSDSSELIISAGKDKGKTLPADVEELQAMGIYPAEDWNKYAEGANVRQVALDVNKMIDAQFKGYDRAGKAPPIKELVDLDPQGNKWAQSVISQAKQGNFDWSNTKYPEAQKAWETILIPQLEKKGYDAIQYWDDMHPTTAVFRNDQIKDVPVFKPSEAEKDTAVSNILKFIKDSGVTL